MALHTEKEQQPKERVHAVQKINEHTGSLTGVWATCGEMHSEIRPPKNFKYFFGVYVHMCECVCAHVCSRVGTMVHMEGQKTA